MTEKTIAPYGSWKSDITPDLIVAGTINLGQIVRDGANVYWVEGRPAEDGRNVIVRWREGEQVEDITPPPFNVRTRVHEYGGGSYTVRDGSIVFSNFADQRLYQHYPGQDPQPVTSQEKIRFADGVFANDGCFVCVREDHRREGTEAVTALVVLKLDGEDAGQVLVSGNDFYASPRFSPDGRQLAWLTWNHPNMPWDGTELWLADYDPDGSLSNAKLVAGGQEESIFQPEWSPGGVLHYVSDRSGWWNLYRQSDNGTEALYPTAAEFGRPQWVFGMRAYAFVSEQKILCVVTKDGLMSLNLLDTERAELQTLDLPYTFISGLTAAGESAYFDAGTPELAPAIVRLNLHSLETKILRRSSKITVAAGDLSVMQAIEFPTSGGLTAHGFFYPPKNRAYRAPDEERPPLIVMSHGGPTGAARPFFSVDKQYWTNRGFAVLDVNYGGSVGFGRAYRQRLNGQWGVVDVEDCINGARYLVDEGLVDGQRLAIRGGSAGGYTTLCALTFHDTFKAGASYFGVCDIEALAKETHKFESRYLDRMIGPYPEQRDVYIQRSPIHFVDQINCPIILFQGLEDRVVPYQQAEVMFEAVKTKGIPVAYLLFPGEQHGFRRAENIKRTLEAELYFYARVFGLELADMIEPVKIENLADGESK